MPRQNVRHLRHHGPSTRAELPGSQIRQYDRDEGARKFFLNGSPSTRMGGNVTPVFYLAEHDRKDVLRRFLEANPKLVELKTFRSFQQLLGDQTTGWKEASRAIRDEFFDESVVPPGTANASGTRCPNCGEELSFKGLPAHLRSGCKMIAD